jgi:DNA replication protein DnaC
MLNEPTLEKLRAMRLTGMADAWLEQQGAADTRQLGFDERFGMLVDAEQIYRENRRLTTRLKQAKLRVGSACVEDFENPQKRGIDKALLRQLSNCRWIDEHLNVVITGLTGVGKTYLACALGQAACRRGYRVMYRRTPRFIDELTLARADGTLARSYAQAHGARRPAGARRGWGLTPLRDQDRRDLLEVIDDRDGARSTLLASQIPVAKWHDYLGDPTIADAIADRLLHSAHRIVLKGPSRRKSRANRGVNKEN